MKTFQITKKLDYTGESIYVGIDVRKKKLGRVHFDGTFGV